MNVSEPRPKAIYINIDLLFDFYSVLFSAYRTYFAKSSISINELKRTIEGRNLRNGLKSLLQEIPESFALDTVNQELKPFIDISLKSIKPNVNAFALVQNFVNNGSAVKVFTNFEDEVIKYVEEAHKDWFNFQVIKIENLSDLKINFDQEYQDNIVFIDSSVESCTNIKKEENIQVIYIPHSKRMLENFHQDESLKKELENLKITAKESLEDVEWDRIGVLNTIKWPETSYYLKLDSKPTNEAYNVWRNVSQLEQPIELTSKIVHGFGRGGKKLGIPTANLDMTSEIEEKLVDLVNGVYYGWAEFIVAGNSDNKEEMSYNQRLPMVMSIGFNPYFNNKYKTAEVHIMQKFDADFYDNTLKVEVLGFIRNEADFMKFSHLIEAIHNDVQVAKDILLQ